MIKNMDIKEVIAIKVKIISFSCPYCNFDCHSDSKKDPRGKIVVCENCENVFLVSDDADLIIE